MSGMEIEELKKDNLSFPWSLTQYLKTRHNSYTEYVRVWQIYRGELVRRTFAFKTKRGYGQLVTEVMRDIPTTEECIAKNIYYNGMSGYTTVYDRHVRTNWYGYRPFDPEDFDKWFKECKSLGISVVEELDSDAYLYCEKYKRCGYQSSSGNLLTYLRAYVKDPAVEYFGKLGIEPKPSYLKLAKKDKQFVRFLIENAEQVKQKNPEVVLFAYRNRITLAEAGNIVAKKRNALSCTMDIKSLKGTGIDRVKVYEYLRENLINKMLYDDYLEAVKGLGLDLTDTKNIFPKDIFRMHDLRVDEYASFKAKKKAEERAKFESDFSKKCQEYFKLAEQGETYQVVIPEHISDLIYEGDKLHHCVGKMGYDKKVIDGVSIIAFVRRVEEPTQPFVTVEYKPKEHKVTQCYAEHDTKPSQEVLDYVADWEQKVTKILKERKKNEKNNLRVR